jgi:hypothetical protein
MAIELIVSYVSVVMSLASGISSLILWIKYLKPARKIIRTVWKDDDLNDEGDLYIIGVSGRFG